MWFSFSENWQFQWKMGTQTVVESDFNELQFEKQLTSLKDSQEAINSCCKWCLENRVNHKKIVNCWLNVLKRVKVEQRLILFYLANDVVQYSKRRNYDFVASWGTAIQKATTMVRWVLMFESGLIHDKKNHMSKLLLKLVLILQEVHDFTYQRILYVNINNTESKKY